MAMDLDGLLPSLLSRLSKAPHYVSNLLSRRERDACKGWRAPQYYLVPAVRHKGMHNQINALQQHVMVAAMLNATLVLPDLAINGQACKTADERSWKQPSESCSSSLCARI